MISSNDVIVAMTLAEVPLSIMEISDFLEGNNDEVIEALNRLKKMNVCIYFEGLWFITDWNKAVKMVEAILCEKES